MAPRGIARVGAMILAVASLVTANACSPGKESSDSASSGSSSVSLDF